jgi:hypothetical protein
MLVKRNPRLVRLRLANRSGDSVTIVLAHYEEFFFISRKFTIYSTN